MTRLILAAAVLASLAASAADLTPVVVLPTVVESGKVSEGIPLAIQEKASSLLLSTNRYAVVHSRQVSSMASRHRMKLDSLGDANNARLAAERLGAKVFAFSSLAPVKNGWTLKISVSRVGDPSTVASTAEISAGEGALAFSSAAAIAAAVAQFEKGENPKADGADLGALKDAAVRDYSTCISLVNRQSLGIENPTILNEAELIRAVGLCGSAVKADPTFQAAWAALALASAVGGNDERAIFALSQTRSATTLIPNAVLARFWLVSRYQSPADAETVLKDAVAKNPGFLLGRTYLGELYNGTNRHADAAKIWQDYATLMPNNPYAVSKLAYTLARMGKAAEAAGFAEKALAFDPDSIDLNLELASRYLDAGNTAKAISVLEPMSKAKDVRAEVVLRLGYAKLLAGDLDAADALLNRAYLAALKDPADWRTRGRARLNQAHVALARGKKDDAKKLTKDAFTAGPVVKAGGETDKLLALFTAEELKAVTAKTGVVKVKESVAVSDAPAKAAPKGFDEVKVAPAPAPAPVPGK